MPVGKFSCTEPLPAPIREHTHGATQHTRVQEVPIARLQRAKLGRERYAQCMRILMLAVVCGSLGEDDMFLVLGAYWLVKWRAYSTTNSWHRHSSMG